MTTKYIFQRVKAIPESLKEGMVYVGPTMMCLICPCGCKEVISLSTDSDSESRWKVFNNTIVPPIYNKNKCSTKFVILNGKAIIKH